MRKTKIISNICWVFYPLSCQFQEFYFSLLLRDLYSYLIHNCWGLSVQNHFDSEIDWWYYLSIDLFLSIFILFFFILRMYLSLSRDLREILWTLLSLFSIRASSFCSFWSQSLERQNLVSLALFWLESTLELLARPRIWFDQ